jgi:hypothetical protein
MVRRFVIISSISLFRKALVTSSVPVHFSLPSSLSNEILRNKFDDSNIVYFFHTAHGRMTIEMQVYIDEPPGNQDGSLLYLGSLQTADGVANRASADAILIHANMYSVIVAFGTVADGPGRAAWQVQTNGPCLRRAATSSLSVTILNRDAATSTVRVFVNGQECPLIPGKDVGGAIFHSPRPVMIPASDQLKSLNHAIGFVRTILIH